MNTLQNDAKSLARAVEEALAIERALTARLDRIKKFQPNPPGNWIKPPFKSESYRKARYLGWITENEYLVDCEVHEARRARAHEKTWGLKGVPRSDRPHPVVNGQYTPEMSTEAARSQRLTPNAKALLQIIFAYSSKKGWWSVTKTFLAKAMGVSPRTIKRYLTQLEEEGFLEVDIEQRRETGMVKGLVVYLSEKAFPLFKRKLFRATLGNLDRTKLTLNNQYLVRSIIKYTRHQWKVMCLNPFLYERTQLDQT